MVSAKYRLVMLGVLLLIGILCVGLMAYTSGAGRGLVRTRIGAAIRRVFGGENVANFRHLSWMAKAQEPDDRRFF